MSNSKNERWLELSIVSRRMNTTARTIRRWIVAEKFNMESVSRIGWKYYINEQEVMRFLEDCKMSNQR